MGNSHSLLPTHHCPLRAHRGEGERLSGGLVVVAAALAELVPDEASASGPLAQGLFLRGSGAQSELVAAWKCGHTLIYAPRVLAVSPRAPFGAHRGDAGGSASQGESTWAFHPLHPLFVSTSGDAR